MTELAILKQADEDQSLGEKITLLAGQINAANYQLLKLNWKCAINIGAAREKVRVAHCLEGSERCQIMLHVDIDTLQKHSCDGHRCNIDDTHWISPTTARRLACDATLVTVLEDKSSKVLNIGRRARTVPAHIKRALSIRDKTCRVPGCCQ